MADQVKDILKSEGWGRAEGWRAFHYFVALPDGHTAKALCSININTSVPLDSFWPVPPSSVGQDAEGFGACDICRLASTGREWAKDGVSDALQKALWALKVGMGREAMRDVDLDLRAPLTPEKVCNALGQFQRYAVGQYGALLRAERAVAVYELARQGMAFLSNPDYELHDAFSVEVVDVMQKLISKRRGSTTIRAVGDDDDDDEREAALAQGGHHGTPGV